MKEQTRYSQSWIGASGETIRFVAIITPLIWIGAYTELRDIDKAYLATQGFLPLVILSYALILIIRNYWVGGYKK
jgi:hypothetical protein